jgi:hypothetical protein
MMAVFIDADYARAHGRGQTEERNDEVGTMNDELKASCLYFIVHRSAFIVSPTVRLPCAAVVKLSRRAVVHASKAREICVFPTLAARRFAE